MVISHLFPVLGLVPVTCPCTRIQSKEQLIKYTNTMNYYNNEVTTGCMVMSCIIDNKCGSS